MAATINRDLALGGGLPGGNSSALDVTTTGLVIAGPRQLATVVSSVSGTLTINDCTSGPATSNQVASITVTAGVPVSFNLWPFFAGIYFSAIPASAVLAVAFN